MAVRICLASAGLWWGAFTLIPLRRLRDRRSPAAETGEATAPACASSRRPSATCAATR